MPARRWTPEAISEGGERVSHLTKDFYFFAHLSIYRFALPFAQGARVLDVGCGAGYGSAFLADHGASLVHGIDASTDAVEFSRAHFVRPNLRFATMRAEEIVGFQPRSFDLIFTSNTLEHVEHVARFMSAASRLLTPSGVLLVAVPPITNDQLLYVNVINRYHLNLWSPRQWAHVISTYFEGRPSSMVYGRSAKGHRQLISLPRRRSTSTRSRLRPGR